MPVRALSALALLLLAAAAPAATLQHVEVDATEPFVVRLRLDAAVRVRSEAIPPRDGQPARIVVDLAGTRVGRGVRGVAGAGRLHRVRVGQYDETTARVVLDLVAPTAFTVEDDGAEVTIRLARETPPAAATTPSPPPPRTLPKGGAAPYLDYDDGEMQPLPTLPEGWKH